jgi:hypothetical protein
VGLIIVNGLDVRFRAVGLVSRGSAARGGKTAQNSSFIAAVVRAAGAPRIPEGAPFSPQETAPPILAGVHIFHVIFQFVRIRPATRRRSAVSVGLGTNFSG